MKRFLAMGLLSLMTATQAHADWDPELEAQERAKYEAAQREQAARDAAAAKIRREAEAKAHAAMIADKRKYVGAAAQGKSDAEVERLYDQKVAEKTREGENLMAEGQRRMNDPAARAATKEVTGYSMEEMSNMSDAELEALSRQMEQKYGGGN
jgi:hypothetical protein